MKLGLFRDLRTMNNIKSSQGKSSQGDKLLAGGKWDLDLDLDLDNLGTFLRI